MPLHRAIDLAVRALFLLFNLIFPCLHFIPFVFGNDLDKGVLTFENKKPCLCLQLRFPDPSTYGNFEIREGEKEGGKQTSGRWFWKKPFQMAKPQSLEPLAGHKESTLVCPECAGYSGPGSQRRRGQSPGFLGCPELNSLLAPRLGQKVAAEHQALWARQSFWITQQVPRILLRV